MTASYGFYDSVSGDRSYNALQMSRLFEGIIVDGIFANIGTAMRVVNPSLLVINVGIGRAWFNNSWTANDSVFVLGLAAADFILPRIDAVVLEIDSSPGVRANTIKILTGTPASSPAYPTLASTSTKHQYALAYCRVNAGSTTVNVLTDMVGGVATPYVITQLESVLSKAIASEVVSGTDNVKYITPKALKDSINVPNAAPGAKGNILGSNGTNWVSMANDGWLPDSNTWSYSSVDGPTGVVSINADVTGKIQTGMKLKWSQTRTVSSYMPMDANSATTIGPAVLTDTAITYTAGKIGNAATLNGTTSKIVITDDIIFKPTTNSFTLGLWIKATSSGANQGIFQSYAQNTNYAGISIEMTSAGKIQILIGKNSGTVVGTDYTSLLSKTGVGDTVWHYVVLTIRNNYLQLYIDGVLDTYDYCLTPAYAATNYVRLGCRNLTGTDSNFLAGQIDDVYHIYGYAVDEEFIRARYLAANAQTTSVTFTKKSIVTNVGAFSGGVTLVTSFFGTDFEMSTDGISNPYFSDSRAPFGFNMNPDKWSVFVQNPIPQVKATPTLNVYYGGSGLTPAGLSISAPIGAWNPTVRAGFEFTTPATIGHYSCRVTFSSTETTETNPRFSSLFQVYNGTAVAGIYKFPIHLSGLLLICLVKTTFNILMANTPGPGTVTTMSIMGSPLSIIQLTSAYL